MALTNFIPQLWSGALLAHLDKAHVVANLVNRNYEGMIRQAGDTVIINQLGDITIKDYTENTDIEDPETLSTEKKTLVIDKQKYFNFQVDDVDKAQVAGNLMDEAMRRVAYALADATEKIILTEMDTNAGTKIVPTASLSAENIYNELVGVKVAMDKKNVPSTGRWLIVSPDTHALLLQDQRFVATGGSMAESNLQNGFIGKVLGFEVYLSNNLETLTNGNGAIAGVNMACTFAEQIVETEAYRMEKRFADSVKGLNVFGVKVIYPDCLVCLKKTNP